MSDFLLELLSEEIPARMQARAREDLAKLFVGELAKAGLPAPAITTYATPRRLTLIARGLPEATAAVREETKGPKLGAPPQALDGFLRKTGLTVEQLTERDGVYFAVVERPGRATADVLAAAIPAIVRGFPWPKSMRWGAASASTESQRWVRPLQGIVALFGGAVVACEAAGLTSGRETRGHRFMAPGTISIESAATYVEQLRAAHVIVDQEERANIIALGATMAARKAGLTLIEDAGLLVENAGLTEWPVPLLGRFDAGFLSVPPEVIQLTARVNQKYFVCRDAAGALANAFVCVANIDAADGGARIVEGNRKVLAARLSDARFFYETDLKVSLDEQREKLHRIVFHEKLGTVADKVARVAKLARWLCEEGIIKSSPGRGGGPLAEGEGGRGFAALAASADGPPPPPASPVPLPVNGEDLADCAERAALLCKADLVTGMVGEFPELQGVMGGYYAAAQGVHPAVAAAIRDHYKPVGQSDDVPTDPVTVAVSLADKLDDLSTYFSAGEVPTGSRDPFALRRACLASLRLIESNGLRLSIEAAVRIAQRELPRTFLNGTSTFYDVVPPAFSPFYDINDFMMPWGTRFAEAQGVIKVTDAHVIDGGWTTPSKFKVLFELPSPYHQRQILLAFFADRLKVQQREAGVRHDLIDAVFALGGEDDLVRLLARVHALQAFMGSEDGANLLAGYKRAANILKKEGYSPSPLQGGGPRRGEAASAAGTAPLPTLSPEGERALEPAEAALAAALDAAEPRAAAAVAAEKFEEAMAALATLRAPIDAFFDAVMVNDPDPAKRAARLALLARFRAAVHQVADFSKIEG